MYISKREFFQLLKCWQNMPKSLSHTPYKTAFTPSSISKLLPHVFLLELTRDGTFQLRLIGTELETVLGGKDRSRLYFQELIYDEENFFGEFINLCMKKPMGGLLKQRLKGDEEGYIQFEAFTVPLADEHGVPRFVLGAVSAERHFLNPPVKEGIKDKASAEFFDLEASEHEIGVQGYFGRRDDTKAETVSEYFAH